MKRLNVVKVIDQFGWSYDFIGREQQRYSQHNLIVNKYDNINLSGVNVIYIHSPNICEKLSHQLPIECKKKGIKVIGAYGGDPRFWHQSVDVKYSYVDLVVTISPETYKFASNLYADVPVIFLPESVDTNFFRPSQFCENVFNVGWAGSRFSLKRIHLLDKLKYPVVKQSQWGQEYFKENRKQDSMLKFYQFLSTFVLTSTTECMPRVVLEAMACGLPIVSTNVGNLPFLIEQQWLVPIEPDSVVVEQMNQKLDILKKDIDLRKNTGLRNRSFVDRFFSWRVNQPIWDSVFSNLYEDNLEAIISENQKYLEPYKKYFEQSCLKKNFKRKTRIAYLLPGTCISGGIAVILQHANRLQELGYDVLLISQDLKTSIPWYSKNKVQIVPLNSKIQSKIDILIATGWTTIEASKSIKSNRKIYFVQSDERRFYDDEQTKKLVADTYQVKYEYMTEAKWIQTWLKQEFGHNSYYVPNGIDTSIFFKSKIDEKNRPRVLLEGPLTIPFKGVVDAYEAVKNLDCEIWIVSSDGKPPKNWKYDRFFEKVNIDDMKNIYSSCDILLKMSRVEGFFGPPMEAMACGCSVVVSKCTGYDEYIEHEKNALVVDMGDICEATKAVNRLLTNETLRKKLVQNGYETIKEWTWDRSLKYLDAVICNKTSDLKNEIETKDVKTIELNKEKYKIDDCCDIIIVVHNALDYVRQCIESIVKYTNFNYKIIIVDNNSNQETKNYLKSIKNVQIIVNEKNYGFGYANNKAFRTSNSKYVCFLNSDTIVTENWLSILIEDLEANNAGLIGPVSNNVSSEVQKIDFPITHNDFVIQSFAEKRSLEFKNKVVEYNRLIGFCILAKRETLEKSGCFDDRYVFNFEDDDLCLRVIEQGYRLYCSLGVFIYHFGGQSFKDRFKTETHSLLLETSKKLYVEKWYSTNRIKHIHEIKERFSVIYLLASDSPSGGVKVVFEHANRLRDRGYDVKIYCNKNETKTNWFDVYVPIIYFSNYSEIPECDIAIGTYFTTLQVLQKIRALVKIHLCQGYEVSLYDPSKDLPLILTIQDDYRRIKEKIVVSKWLKEIIDCEFQIDSNYIPNGLNNYVFSLSKHERNKIPRILIVGNYNLEFKGVKIALEAAIKYSELNKAIIIRLASEKTKFDDKFTFYDMSKMSQNEIAKIYEMCDVTVCASFKVEGFSLPPLESMASGTPVVTTDNGGVNDYAINNENAIIVSPGNIKEIYRSIDLVLSSSTIYSRLVENGLKTANEYIWYKQIDLLEGLLERLYKKQKALMREQLSICMIVKNEEQYLENCLESIKELANEIIVVDTGSVDETVRIAKKFGAKIYHFDWNDNFSDARNYALEKVTQPWTLILDADEVINSHDIDKIRNLVKNENIAYNFITRNYVDSRNIEGIISCTGEYPNEEKDSIGWCKSEKVRLFPTILGIKFEGQIHELVENSLKRLNIEVRNSDVFIHHFGYRKNNKNKQEEYLKLSQTKAKTQDEKSLYELALQYMSLNNYDEALVIWRKLLEIQPNNFDYLAHTGTTFNLLNDYKQAEKYFLESIGINESEYAIKHFAICYAKQEKHEDAYRMFKKIVYSTDDLKTMADFSFCCNVLKKFDESITILEKCLNINKRETVSWGLLEVAYNEKGIELAKRNRLPQAINMFRSSISINPNFTVARANLVEVTKLLNSSSFSKKFIK